MIGVHQLTWLDMTIHADPNRLSLLCHWCAGGQPLHQKEHEVLKVYTFGLTAKHLLKVFLPLCPCNGNVVQVQLSNIFTESVQW